jgi:hypothetical protein
MSEQQWGDASDGGGPPVALAVAVDPGVPRAVGGRP